MSREGEVDKDPTNFKGDSHVPDRRVHHRRGGDVECRRVPQIEDEVDGAEIERRRVEWVQGYLEKEGYEFGDLTRKLVSDITGKPDYECK